MSSPQDKPSTAPPAKHRGRRRWRYLVWPLVLISVTAGALFTWGLHTQSGARWALRQLNDILPALQTGAIEGSFSGGLSVHRLRYRQAGLKADIQRVDLSIGVDWLPRPSLRIEPLTVTGLQLQLPPPAPASDEPFAAPELAAPLLVQLRDLRLHDVEIVDHQGASLLQLEQLTADIDYHRELHLAQFQFSGLSTAEYSVAGQLQGQSVLNPPYAHQLQLQLQAAIPQLPQVLALQVRSEGSLDQLQWQLNTDDHPWLQGLSATLQLHDALQQPQLELDLAAQQLRWDDGASPLALNDLQLHSSGRWPQLQATAHWQQQTPQTLAGRWQFSIQRGQQSWLLDQLRAELNGLQLQAQGQADTSLQQAQLELLVEMFNAESFQPALAPLGRWQGRIPIRFQHQQLSIEGAALQQQDSAAQIHLDAAYQLNDQQIVLDTRWQQLSWLDTARQLRSPQGQLQLTGALDDYRLNGQFDLQATDLPAGTLELDAHGGQDQLQLTQLAGDWLDGTLQLSGALQWQPALSWQLDLDAQQVNPQGLMSDLNGRLNLTLNSHGAVRDQALEAAVTVQQLSGELLDKPIAGAGELRYRDGQLHSNGFQLKAADAQLLLHTAPISTQQQDQLEPATIDTAPPPIQALNWELHIPRASQLISAAQGKLDAQGWLAHRGQHWVGNAQFNATDSNWQQWRSAALDATIDWRLPWPLIETDWQLAADLNIQQLQANELAAPLQLQLLLDAQPDAQQLQLQAQQDSAQFAMELRGQSLNLAPFQFTGQLQQLELTHETLGHWQQTATAPLHFAQQETPTQFQVQFADRSQPFCLSDANGPDQLCLSLHSSTIDQHLMLQLEALDTARFNPWLPALQIAESRAEGEVHLQLINFRPQQLEAQFSLSPGTLMRNGTDDTRRFALGGWQLHAHGIADQPLQVDTQLQLEGDAQLQVQLALHDWLEPGRTELDGQLDVSWQELRSLGQLLPELDQLGGSLNGRWTVRGRPQQPQLQGQLQLSDASWADARSGLELRDGQLQLIAQADGQYQFDGNAKLGGGQMQFNGTANPLNRTAAIQLSGQQLQLLNGADGQLYASPDLQLQLQSERVDIHGEILIPRARLQPAVSNNPVSESPDVVIAGLPPAPPASGPALHGQLAIRLGDDVKLNADKARAKIGGAIQLQWHGEPIPTALGRLDITKAGVRAYGQNLEVQRGVVLFENGPVDDPQLDIRAIRRIFGDPLVEEAGIHIDGSAQNPRVRLYTNPTTNEERALSYLITGSNFDHGNGQGALSLGVYLLPRLFVSYGFGLFESGNVASARYELSRRWSVQMVSGARDTGVDLSWRIHR